MKKPVIALDLDDTLFEHFNTLKDWHNASFGTKLTLSDNHPFSKQHWGTPELQKATLKRWNAKSVQEAVSRVQKFFDTAQFTDAEPYKGSVKVIRQLSENHDIIVVTARDLHLENITRAWLSKNFDGAIKDIYLTARYNLHGKSKSKTEVLKTLGAAFVIDDNLEICIDAAEAGISAIVFGNYPWNQMESLPKGVTRVNNWQEVWEFFHGQLR